MRKEVILSWILLSVILAISISDALGRITEDTGFQQDQPVSTKVVALDGKWLLAIDPNETGKTEQWFSNISHKAQSAEVPGIIQDVFGGYHGVAWYWREFIVPDNPHVNGRYLIRLWSVFYKAEVWLNGEYIGEHESFNTPFSYDVTKAVKQGQKNLLTVRVIDPSEKEIEGYVRGQVPGGNLWPYGGLEESVELLIVPSVRIKDMFVRPNAQTGSIQISAEIENTTSYPVLGKVYFNVSLARSGEIIKTQVVTHNFRSGGNMLEAEINVPEHRLWSPDNPYLYRVSAFLNVQSSDSVDEFSLRCGFRVFRVEDGYFKINGKRIFLRSSHSGNEFPIGIHHPKDPDLLRRDIINAKAMGFNCIRYFQSTPLRYQLDLCDEIGLMAVVEPRGGWLYDQSPHMLTRYTNSVKQTIMRDRNHVSVIMWGLLNEHPWTTGDSEQFRHTVNLLPIIRSLDDSRLVFLNSGRWDCQPGIGTLSNPGSDEWEHLLGVDSPGAKPVKALCAPGGGIRKQQGASPIAGYVGPLGDIHVYPRVPHTAETIDFLRTVGENTKNVYVSEYGIASAVNLVRLARHYEQRNQESCDFAKIYRERLNLFLKDWNSWDLEACFGRPEDFFLQCLSKNAEQRLLGINALRANPKVIGYGITGTADQGRTGEGLVTVFREFKPGVMEAVRDGFAPLRWCLFVDPVNLYRGMDIKLDAVLANEDILEPGQYPVRFEVFDINNKKVFSKNISINIPGKQNNNPLALPVFSEQVVADWPSGKYRFVATIERGGAAAGREAVFYVADCKEMPKVKTPILLWGDDQKLLAWMKNNGIGVEQYDSKSIKENCVIIASKAADQSDEQVYDDLIRQISKGCFVIFITPEVFSREYKGGAFIKASYLYNVSDTNIELFGEITDKGPSLGLIYYNDLGHEFNSIPNGYHGLVLGTNQHRPKIRWTAPQNMNIDVKGVFTEGNSAEIAASIRKNNNKIFSESGLKDLIFDLNVLVKSGDSIDFVLDETDNVNQSHTGLMVKIFSDDGRVWNLNSEAAESQPKDKAFAGSKNVNTFGCWSYGFESDESYYDAVGWIPLKEKGEPIPTNLTSYVYTKDTWAKTHPIFDGLPTGGIMDYTYYRELFSDQLWKGQDVPDEAVAGAIVTSWNYYSGLRIAVYKKGAGQFILNSFRIRENLGTHPAAERLLRNMLRYAAENID